jgi:hypothetical protein
VLKGSGFALLAGEVSALVAFGLGVVILASVRFRKRLE